MKYSRESEDIFYIKLAEYWFLWLEWLLIFGTVSYLADIIENILIDILTGSSFVILGNYFWAQILIIIEKVFPSGVTNKKLRIITFVLGFGLMSCIYFFIQYLIPDLKKISM